jgi:hypothetical protein
MNTTLLPAVLLAMCAICPAQTKAHKQEPDYRKDSRIKPVSQYMRKVALIYLEKVDDFMSRCLAEVSDACATDEWEKILGPLEDRIQINLTGRGYKKSPTGDLSGDEGLFSLLRSAKFETEILASKVGTPHFNPESDEFKEQVEIASTCKAYAHFDAVNGTFQVKQICCDEIAKNKYEKK